MGSIQYFYTSIVALIFLFLAVSLVRKRLLLVRHAILWLSLSLMLLFFIVQYDFVVWIDKILNLGEPKNLFFFVLIFFLLLICIQFSLVISKLLINVKNLAQELALIKIESSKNNKEICKENNEENNEESTITS